MVYILFTFSNCDLSCFSCWSVQEVSSMLLEKIVAAGIGDRPVVFVTHRYVQWLVWASTWCFWVSLLVSFLFSIISDWC